MIFLLFFEGKSCFFRDILVENAFFGIALIFVFFSGDFLLQKEMFMRISTKFAFFLWLHKNCKVCQTILTKIAVFSQNFDKISILPAILWWKSSFLFCLFLWLKSCFFTIPKWNLQLIWSFNNFFFFCLCQWLTKPIFFREPFVEIN